MMPTGVPCGDVWKIPPELKAKYDQQFYQLKPMNGFITGEQAKNLFLQSGLPSQVLAQIWALADRNGDGKMDLLEFTIAMHLIQMKLKGIELPKVIPPTLQVVTTAPVLNAAAGFRPSAPMGVPTVPASVPANMAPLASGFIRPASPVDSKMHRSSSVSSQDSPTSGMPAPLTEWAVPQPSKLKFTQLFNSYDRTRTGFLTGAQAKNILISTGLSQPILAQIWSLADIDSDGRLSTEEFVLAMHLTEMVKAGDSVPRVLPPELIPPSHRRKRSTSIVSSNMPPSHTHTVEASLLGDLKDDKLLQQTTFEDKRRENFEKGQAELERRRLALLESQRKEQEERERKEREEMERRERIRQEQERRRQLELEKQLAKQRELEQEKEEQRRKALEQREAARREMERQRQLEWEKQRQQELLMQRQKEQEAVCHMKNRSKNLTYELEQLSNKIIELNERIIETRKGVTDMKSSIDSMRSERDSKLNDMNEVKGKIKEMNDRLLIITQEKLSLKSQLQDVGQHNPTSDAYNVVVNSFSNKQITIHRLKTSLDNIEKETDQKQKDIESSNSQLQQLKDKLDELMESHRNLYQEFEDKRLKVVALKKTRDTGVRNQTSVEKFEDAWGPVNAEPANENWDAFGAPEAANTDAIVENVRGPNVLRYRILYAFESRNPDELSVMPGDIVLVPEGQSPEPGWLGGELHGKRGWFPEAYAELIAESVLGSEGGADTLADNGTLGTPTETVHIVGTEMKWTLEGISEAPENISDVSDADKNVRDVLQHSENSSFTQPPKANQVTSPESAESPVPGQSQALPEDLQAQALFPWKAKKENHLSFNKGDVITVKEQQDMWWYGEFQEKCGWFPKSYVKLISGPMKMNDNAFENAFNNVGESAEMFSENGAAEYHIATYAYQSQEPGDLCFQPGETICVTKKEGEWWTGSIDNERTGIFPSNYVRKLEPHEAPTVPAQEPEIKSESPLTFSVSEGSKTLKKAEIVVVLAPYHATGPEQLTLEKGQLVQVRKKSPSGWWEGEIQVKGRKRQVGWFPASYVRPHTGSAASSARSTPEPILPKHSDFMMNGINQQQTPPSECKQVVALYPFNGEHEDELTFQKGSIINLLSNSDPAWWRGELDGTVGLFPSNYVEFTGRTVPMPNK